MEFTTIGVHRRNVWWYSCNGNELPDQLSECRSNTDNIIRLVDPCLIKERGVLQIHLAGYPRIFNYLVPPSILLEIVNIYGDILRIYHAFNMPRSRFLKLFLKPSNTPPANNAFITIINRNLLFKKIKKRKMRAIVPATTPRQSGSCSSSYLAPVYIYVYCMYICIKICIYIYKYRWQRKLNPRVCTSHAFGVA